MTSVFGHGRLRLYLLNLLAESPKHGYELIRRLEDQFLGSYAPSAGTVYPRLARMEGEGLITHSREGGRKVYTITEAGRDELDRRRGELADLEREIRDSVRGVATEIQHEVRGSTRDVKAELRAAARAQRKQKPVRERWAAEEWGPTPEAPRGNAAAERIASAAGDFAGDVARAARGARRTEEQASACQRILDAALREVRDALR